MNLSTKLVVAMTVLCSASTFVAAQSRQALRDLIQPKDYAQRRASSYDRTGGDEDFRTIAPGETLCKG